MRGHLVAPGLLEAGQPLAEVVLGDGEAGARGAVDADAAAAERLARELEARRRSGPASAAGTMPTRPGFWITPNDGS